VGLTAQLSNPPKRLSDLWQSARKPADGKGRLASTSPLKPHRGTWVTQVQRRLPAEAVVELVKAYKAGRTLKELAVEFQIHRRTVAAHLERHGVPRRAHVQRLDDEQITEAIRLYVSGLSLVRVSQHFDVNAETVRRALLQAGIRLRPKGRRRRM
jgi:hypothetical protein